ncbi:MAG: aminotransferase class V-fold PLP-dependent enzyme [Treponema sp.]|jgi:cysteine desulfurase family protein|nr:aminotransferase class V-fold PLP-dependent enzyme [Treponema sp.]
MTESSKPVYLDNAATSFPKPESVYEAVLKTMREECGNPGRAGHRLSLAAGRNVNEARVLCARLFNAQSPENIVFTPNTTAALNMAIKGIVEPGDHVITSSLEHNSVSRPLACLERSSVTITKVPTDLLRGLGASDIEKAVRPDTKLVVCTHVSNVTGTINDIASIGAFCGSKGILFLVDAAQSAGSRFIDVQDMRVDMLAFPGHKGLLGPQGTGGLYIRPGLELKTIIQGGTGSESESLSQPETMPDKFESGTLNTPGLAGLAAGIRFIMEEGIEKIEQAEAGLTKRLIEGINAIRGIRLIGPGMEQNRGNVVSVCLEKTSPAAAALMMDSAFQIAVRSGIHCAADAHRSAGTLENGGALRISPNYFNTPRDIDICLEALEYCAKGL